MGISEGRIKAVGYGESKSSNPEDSDVASDRKVSVTVIKSPPPSTTDKCGN